MDENFRLWPRDSEIAVSEVGEVLSFKDRWSNNQWHLLKPSIGNSGYLYVGMYGPNSGLVHRIVAETWVYNPNPNLFKEVNHIDGDKLNNYSNNLEWTTRSRNVQHSYNTGLRTGPSRMKIRVVETNDIFDSQLEAAKALNLNQGDISNALAGKVNHVQGYTFERVLEGVIYD